MSCKRTARRPPRKLRITIDSLAFGGDAVGHAEDGRVVFVAGAAPGDEVEVEIEEEHKGYLKTRLARVLRPGPARIAPPCPAFVSGCGGCQWQHVDVAAQRSAKSDIVERALRKVATTVEPIVAPGPDYGWRRRARLRFRRGALGYARQRSHELIEATVCPQLEPALEAALAPVRALLAGADATGEVELLASPEGVQVALSGRGLDGLDVGTLVGQQGIVSVLLHGQVHGPAELELGDGDHPFRARADLFAQASSAGNAALRRLVAVAARAAVGDLAGRRVLELFAGSGNFTRDLLAAGATVVAVEESAQAAALAAKNLAPWLDRVNFVVRPAGPPLPDGPFDLAVVDPPRTGLTPELAAAISALGCAVVYVSCDPQTLARDLAVVAAGRSVHATPVDLMPQTFHVEVVATVAGERGS